MGADELIRRLKEEIWRTLRTTSDHLTDVELRGRIEQAVFAESEKRYMTAAEQVRVVFEVFCAFRGFDVLQPLLDDPEVTEIMVNGHEDVFIERRGRTERARCRFESRERLEDLFQALVAQVNRTVNEASPIVDARLPDGSCVHVVLPPIALRGPTLTIRKFSRTPLTVDDLIRFEALSHEAGTFLARVVAARYNIFISGGTGSGKTTFLNALSQFIPPHERVVTIEDSAELQLRSIPNLVSLETRNANTEGKGEIAIRDLIRASLRMRPDRIFVGEVRGAEVLDMLQAMNTGHDGSLSTGHANSPADMLSRLETMVLSGARLPVEVIRSQICSAIELIVHLSRFRDGSRKVVEISEVAGMERGEIRLRPMFRLSDSGGAGDAPRLVPTGNPLSRTWKLRIYGVGNEETDERAVIGA